MAGAPWYNRDPDRRAVEEEMMRSYDPGFRPHISSGGLMVWEGRLSTNFTKRFGIFFAVRITCPADFPDHPPRARSLHPRITRSPHMFNDGSMCLFAPDDGFWGPESHAVEILHLAQFWLFSFQWWELTNEKEWPMRPAPHAADAPKVMQLRGEPYRRVMPKVRRNDPCFCGTGPAFKRCHGA